MCWIVLKEDFVAYGKVTRDRRILSVFHFESERVHLKNLTVDWGVVHVIKEDD